MSHVEKNKTAWPFAWAEINLNHLRHNLKIIRRMAKKSGSAILAVVKADAYGHGMIPVAKTLASEGIRLFGVANLEEALPLRKACPRVTILVLGSFHERQIETYVQYRIRPTVSSLEDLEKLEKGLKASQRFPVHVKVDTGMGRLGVWHEAALPFLLRARVSKRILVEGIYTHLSSADDAEQGFTRLQLHRFESLIEKLRPLKILPKYIHAANSLGILRFPGAYGNLARTGILLYGLNPWKGSKRSLFLKPVMSLKTRITFLKDVMPEQPLSYARTFQTTRRTRIATLPVGYSHGYRVGLSNKSFVLVRGQRCPIVGRVTMDQTLVDVGGVHGVRRWDTVTLLGGEGPMAVTAEELAAQLGTIPYEIVCSVHSRIPRVYKGLNC